MRMQSQYGNARQYVEGLARSGRYFFSSADAREALGVSAAAAKVAIHRLSQQGLVSSPARGYYVVVPRFCPYARRRLSLSSGAVMPGN
jgi:predicted transcriptional regulator of viral defense system